MMRLDDPKWRELKGGYKIPYDASLVLRRMERGEDVWEEMWNELHPQGDVGEASYAAVPQLVRIAKLLPHRDRNFYGFVSTIEIERHRKSNPPIPDWLAHEYADAMVELFELALGDLPNAKDALTVQSILGVLALTKGNLKLGALISDTVSSEIDEIMEERAWSELYG
jgi:hypothetical protein